MSWKSLVILLNHDRLSLVRNHLLRTTGPLPSDLSELSAAFDLARQKGLSSLFLRHLTARVLLSGNRAEEWIFQWIRNQDETGKLFGSLPPDAARQGAWICVPVPVVNPSNGRFSWIHFLLGLLDQPLSSPFPPWCKTCLAEDSTRSLKDALEAVSHTDSEGINRIFLWPLLDPTDPPVSGNSLGLPLALGLFFLVRGMDWPRKLVATGGIQSDGSLSPVGFIPQKILAAKERKAELFLCPAGSDSTGIPSSVPVQFVSSLQQAVTFARMFAWGVGNPVRYQIFEHDLRTPERFLDNYRHFPVDVLEWASSCGKLPDLASCVEDLRVFEQAAEVLESVLGDPKRAEILGCLLNCRRLRALADRSEQTAYFVFRWCSAMMTVENHRGRLNEDREQQALISEVEDLAPPQDVARHINRCVVRERHNRYDFRSELPEEFNHHFQRRKARFEGYEVDYVLGSLYGTIAQNEAFCGPARLAQVEENVSNSIRAFGNHRYYFHGLRQWCYLAYARLDADDLTGALSALKRYLDMKEEEQDLVETLQNRTSSETEERRFYLAAVARYLADAEQPDLSEPFWEKFHPLLPDCPREHPWQLWCYNMGRIAWTLCLPEEARQAWKKSVQLCYTEEETTIRPMALLPLAALHATGGAEDDPKAPAGEVLSMIRRSEKLCRDHFRPLVEAGDPSEALDLVWQEPARFFPFMYR